jgi:hypothetical protein
LVGGLFLFEGLTSGRGLLLLLAAVLVGAGAGLDLVLDVLVPGTRERVALDIDVLPRRRLRVSGIGLPEAERFLRVIRETDEAR